MRKLRLNSPPVAYHEAGHAVAQWRFGFKIKEVTIVPDGEVAGSVSHKRSLRLYRLEWEIPTGKQLGRYHDLIVTTLAWEEAQRRFSPRWPIERSSWPLGAQFAHCLGLGFSTPLGLRLLGLEFARCPRLGRDVNLGAKIRVDLAIESGSEICPGQIRQVLEQGDDVLLDRLRRRMLLFGSQKFPDDQLPGDLCGLQKTALAENGEHPFLDLDLPFSSFFALAPFIS